MPLNITVSFEPNKNLVYFDIDASAVINAKDIGHPLLSAFRNLDDIEMDDLLALGDPETSVRVTENLSQWRHVARAVERSLEMGHLWGIGSADSSIQWKDAQGIAYDKPHAIPGPPDAVHSVGTTAINDFLRVGDPCYDWKESKDAHLSVLPGQWTFELTTRDDSEHGMANGHRPARLVAYNADAGPLNMEKLLTSAKPHAICGVDSATCGFMFDAPMPSGAAAKDKWYDAVIDGVHEQKDERAPNVHFAPELNAVIATTFYGDGSYPMFVQYNEQGQAVAVALVTDPGDPLVKQNPHIERGFDGDENEMGL